MALNAAATGNARFGMADQGAAPREQVMFGRFMLPDMSEYPCQVGNLTVDGATFVTDQVPPPGLQIVAYLDEIGRVEGLSGEPIAGGFAVAFTHTGARRERFATRLDWRNGKIDKKGGIEHRRHMRFEPAQSKSHIALPDGRIYACEIIDISLSGAAVKVDVMPSIGTYIMLGKMRGRIVRYIAAGIAIEFLKQLDRAQLSEQIN
jgi:hypothetical protein